MSRNGHSRFPTAAEDKRSHEENVARDQSRQTLSPSYRLAFTDLDFLTSREARPIRLQLELMKPEVLLQEENIVSTIVVFGSARLPEPDVAAARLEAAEKAAADAPNDPKAQRALVIARNMADLSQSYDVAREFGRLVSEHSQQPDARRYVVVTGGGPGDHGSRQPGRP